MSEKNQEFINELSIVLPCYNEEDNIDELLTRLYKVLNKLKIEKYRLIFIDDGSKDLTWNKISEYYKKNKEKIIAIKLSKNFGHQNAIMTAINYCNSKYTFFLDTDLQDPPELLLDMYKKILSDKANVIYAKRKKQAESFIKKITSNLFYKFFNYISFTKIPSQVSEFKLVDYQILNNLKKTTETNPFLRGLISWYGYKQLPIYFDRQNREKGKSGWTFRKMINFAMDGIFGFSMYPMRLSYYISLVIFLLFTIISIIIFINYLLYTNLNIIFILFDFFLLLFAFVFLVLAIISEYVGRIYFEIKNRPRAIIEKILD